MQVHLASVLVAFAIATWKMLRRKGTAVHIVMARLGRVRAHRYTMIGVYLGGIWIAGLLTLLPGRLLHRAAFGS